MTTKTKQWTDGSSATIQYDGQGDGQIIITSDPNSAYEARSMQITVETTDGSGIQRAITINQAAKQRIDLSAAVVTAATQTYSGSAKTPAPTVTLNGSTVPSSGYDVTYSNNINAGTANITITGKGDYTGTAYGTFTINKATPSYTAPSTRSLTYNGDWQTLTTLGSTSHGTIYYSLDETNWISVRCEAKNAGTYYCYWKLVGDSNHSDIDSTYLGTTTIAKASRTVSFSSPTTQVAKGSSVTNSASVSAGDGTISYSSSNTSYATVNSSGKVTGVSKGSVTITASIPETTNYKSASASYTMKVYEWVTKSKTFNVNVEHSSYDDQLSITCQAGSRYSITLTKEGSTNPQVTGVYYFNGSSQYLLFDSSQFSFGVAKTGTFSNSGDRIGVYTYAPGYSGNWTISATVQVF